MSRVTLIIAVLAVGRGVVAARSAVRPLGEGIGPIDDAEWHGYGVGA